MSHHFDSAADRADGRVNPCDLYIFPGAAGTTALILTVNPDAGRSSRTTFRPGAVYEFVLASDAGAVEDIAFRVSFADPGDGGQQRIRVLRADGPAAREGGGRMTAAPEDEEADARLNGFTLGRQGIARTTPERPEGRQKRSPSPAAPPG